MSKRVSVSVVLVVLGALVWCAQPATSSAAERETEPRISTTETPVETARAESPLFRYTSMAASRAQHRAGVDVSAEGFGALDIEECVDCPLPRIIVRSPREPDTSTELDAGRDPWGSASGSVCGYTINNPVSCAELMAQLYQVAGSGGWLPTTGGEGCAITADASCATSGVDCWTEDTEADDCSVQYYCTNSSECTTDGDCSEGDACTSGQSCSEEEGCTRGGNCTEGQYCSAGDKCTANAKCSQHESSSDDECTEGPHCSEGDKCTAGTHCSDADECTKEGNCSYGTDCTTGNDCTKDSDCSDNSYCTHGGNCSDGANCTEGNNCTTGGGCSAGTKCTAHGSCSINVACTSGDVCSSADGCTASYVCSSAPDCTSTISCSKGKYCTSGSHLCSDDPSCTQHPGCEDDDEEPPPGFVMLDLLAPFGVGEHAKTMASMLGLLLIGLLSGSLMQRKTGDASIAQPDRADHGA